MIYIIIKKINHMLILVNVYVMKLIMVGINDVVRKGE